MRLLRYRERLGLTYAQALAEPNEAIETAFIVWSLDAKRDKLEAERRRL